MLLKLLHMLIHNVVRAPQPELGVAPCQSVARGKRDLEEVLSTVLAIEEVLDSFANRFKVTTCCSIDRPCGEHVEHGPQSACEATLPWPSPATAVEAISVAIPWDSTEAPIGLELIGIDHDHAGSVW
jgi:hypothetical protein